jgi:hemerythrin
MPILWRSAMSVGNERIDADHRYLMCLINTVELSLRVGDDADTLNLALDQLSQYTLDHFAREERIQIGMRYVHHDEHKGLHRDLVFSLESLRTRIRAAASAQERQANADELTQLLRQWLLRHILTEDMKMKPALVEHPADFAG